MRLTLVVGTRPNLVKASPLFPALRKAGIRTRLVDAGQHHDPALASALARELGLPRPRARLAVGSAPRAVQVKRTRDRMGAELRAHRPDAVLVFGDVNASLGAAQAAVRARVPLVHVEAGLRSGDLRMPEEVNRIRIDRLSDLLLTTLPEDGRRLRREGLGTDRIVCVGNLMADTLRARRGAARAAGRRLLARLGIRGRFALATLHRPANVDAPPRLGRLLDGLARAARILPVLLPAHPRLSPRLGRLPPGIRVLPPLGYHAFQGLLGRAALVLTDSGGVQHEAALWGTPCLTLRDSTEWGRTRRGGLNRLVPADPARIEREVRRALGRRRRPAAFPLWDGRAAGRAARAVLERFG